MSLVEAEPMVVRGPDGQLVDAECVRIGPGIEIEGKRVPVYIIASEAKRAKYDDGRRVVFSRVELWELTVRDYEGFGEGLRLMVQLKLSTKQPGKRVQVATPKEGSNADSAGS